MSINTKDFLERLVFTMLLAGIAFGTTYLTSIPELWALAILAALQIIKNWIAQQFGNPVTSGFTDTEPMYVEPAPVLADGTAATSEEDLQ